MPGLRGVPDAAVGCMERWGGASQAEQTAQTVRSSGEQRVSPGAWVAMKAERLQDKGMQTIKVVSFSRGLSGSSEAEGLLGLPEAEASAVF